MATIQYSARSCLLPAFNDGLVSHDSIVDDDWLPATEWCQHYLPWCQPASDVEKIWGAFVYEVYRPGNDLFQR